jgi:hypothetical protein
MLYKIRRVGLTSVHTIIDLTTAGKHAPYTYTKY